MFKIIKKGGLILCDDVIRSDYFDTQVNIDALNTILYLENGPDPLRLAK